MLKRFVEEYPDSRHVLENVYGKRLIFSGFDHRSEVYALQALGATSVSLDYYLFSNLKNATIVDSLTGFDVVVLNGASWQIKGLAGSPVDLKNYAADFMMFLEKNREAFTFAIEPYYTYSVLGEDYYLDYLTEAHVRNLPIFPVIYRDNLEFYVTKVFPKHPYVCVTREMALNKSFMASLVSEAKKQGVVLIALDLEETYTIERLPFIAVINSGWKNGSKYGNTYLYKNSRFEKYDAKVKKAIREKEKELISSYNVNYEAIVDDIAAEVDKFNFFSWKDYGDKIALLSKSSYWLTDIEAGAGKNNFIVSKEGPEVLALVDYEERIKDAVREPGRHVSRYLTQQNEDNVTFIDVRGAVKPECNTCNVRDVCRAFRENASCAFHTYAPVRNVEELKNMLGAALGVQYNRVQQAAMQERLLGNELSQEVTKEFEQLFKNSKVLDAILKNTGGENPSDSFGEENEFGVTVDKKKGTMTFVARVMDKRGPNNARTAPQLKLPPLESPGHKTIQLQEQTGFSVVGEPELGRESDEEDDDEEDEY